MPEQPLSNNRVFDPAFQCHGKQRYAKKAWAKRSAKAVEQKIGERLSPYRCPHCGLWHLGHKPMSPSQIAKARAGVLVHGPEDQEEGGDDEQSDDHGEDGHPEGSVHAHGLPQTRAGQPSDDML